MAMAMAASSSQQGMARGRLDCNGGTPLGRGSKSSRKLRSSDANSSSAHENLALILDRLKGKSDETDGATYARLLRACGKFRALPEGKRVHSYIKESGLETDRLLGNHLVEMYLKCGSLRDAQRTFDEMEWRDTILWTTMISAYTERGYYRAAFKLFQKMQQDERAIPDSVTYITILNACGRMGGLEQGRLVHKQITENGYLESDVMVATSLLNMYSKCGSLQEARETFDNIQHPDIVAWNSMLSAYVQNGAFRDAIELYGDLSLEPTVSTFVTVLTACAEAGDCETGAKIHEAVSEKGLESEPPVSKALFNMYGKFGDMDKLERIFEARFQQDPVYWGHRISFYLRHKRSRDGLKLFRKMLLEGVRADKFAFTTSLSACDGTGSLGDGRLIHACIRESGFESDVVVRSALVHMFGRCGSIGEAEMLFYSAQKKNVLLSSAMIAAYAKHQEWKQILQLSREIQFMPYKLRIVDIFKACGQLRALEDGKVLHQKVKDKQLDADIDIQRAVMDMYCKCGSLEDARAVFDGTTDKNTELCKSMIDAYVQHGKLDSALEIFEQMEVENVKPCEKILSSILSIRKDDHDHDQVTSCLSGIQVVSATQVVEAVV